MLSCRQSAKQRGLFSQACVLPGPVAIHLFDVAEAPGVPGPIAVRDVAGGLSRAPDPPRFRAQIARGHVPRQAQAESALLSRRERQRGVEARAHARGTLFVGSGARHLPLGHRLPEHGQRVEPAAAEPATIDAHVGRIERRAEGALELGLLVASGLAQREAARDRAHRCRRPSELEHEVRAVEGEDRVERGVARVAKAVLEGGHRQRRLVGLAGNERAPARDLDRERQLRVAQAHLREGKARLELRLAQARQAVGAARCTAAGAEHHGPVPGEERLVNGHRPLEHAGPVRARALQADRGKRQRLGEDLGPVPQ